MKLNPLHIENIIIKDRKVMSMILITLLFKNRIDCEQAKFAKNVMDRGIKSWLFKNSFFYIQVENVR